MIKYCKIILLMCTLLIQQSVVVDVFDPPGTEPTVSETVGQSKKKEDNGYAKYNGSFSNTKLSEGGDDFKLNAANLNNPVNEEGDEKKVSNETIKSSVVPRKGAHKNSVVPKKGVTIDKSPEETDSNIHRTKINTNKKMQPVKEEGVTLQENTLSKVIKKKPVTSDKDSDDGDTQSFIESSTGQDYMLTGVLIFVCIWASIFGALFFYKRAGEFWDRRHYRRMDFLVEGMYND